MLFNHNVNNLSGGVSQQAEEARYDNQVEEMINFVPTVAQGLRRRNPIQKVADLGTTFTDNMAIHSYVRGDGLEKYGMIFDESGLKVFDTSGVEKTVIDFSGAGDTVLEMWSTASWKDDIKFLTVGDTTWIMNTSMITDIDSDLTPSDTNEHTAFYWIKKSFNDGTSGTGHGYTYQIDLTDLGEVTANHTDSIEAANSLVTLIDGNDGYTAKNYGSIIYITRATAFDISTGDSWGNQASIAWDTGVAKISDLPASMEGFTDAEVGTVAITGTDKDTFTNYYLKWETDHWKETVKEGIEYKIDYRTMPCKLVRQSDGTFVLGWNVENLSYDGFRTTWGERDKGDDDSNPIPSFIGHTLSNIFFFKNRLGFTSEENVILSQTANYYDFFASTVIEILDTDPIDAAADSNNISIIRAVNVTAGAITLWTDTSQFILSGGEVLSPATTRISQTSSYVASTDIEPLSIDNEIMFFNRKGNWIEALSYNPATLNNDKSTAMSLSSHIPEYLPSTIEDVVSAPSENLVMLFSPDTSDTIYIYKYHIDNNKRVMSAWFKWKFTLKIKKINVLDNVLFILSDDNDLHSVELDIKTIDSPFYDEDVNPFVSEVLMSRFNIETRQGTQNIREFFYVKTIKSVVDGDVDVEIVNEERGNTKSINTKHVKLGRRILVGGHSDKVKVRFTTAYPHGVAINAINIEGSMKIRSRNK